MDYGSFQIEISLLYKQKEYKETEDKIYEVLKYYRDRGYISESDKNDLWHNYIKLSNIERRKDNYKQGIVLARLALLYSDNETQKHECYNIMGICYKYLGEIEIAQKYYDKCINFYSKNNDEVKLAKILKCKALMLHDEQLLQDAVDIIKKSKNINIALYEDLVETLNEIKIYNKEKNINIHNIISIDTYKALCNKTTI